MPDLISDIPDTFIPQAAGTHVTVIEKSRNIVIVRNDEGILFIAMADNITDDLDKCDNCTK